MWRNVQVERPSSSTSGGQSDGNDDEVVFELELELVVAAVVAAAPAAIPPEDEACLTIARQDAADVHVLHL